MRLSRVEVRIQELLHRIGACYPDEMTKRRLKIGPFLVDADTVPDEYLYDLYKLDAEYMWEKYGELSLDKLASIAGESVNPKKYKQKTLFGEEVERYEEPIRRKSRKRREVSHGRVRSLEEFMRGEGVNEPVREEKVEGKGVIPPEERYEERRDLQEREIKKDLYLLRKGKRIERILDYEDQGDYIAVKEEDGRWRKYPKMGGFSVEGVEEDEIGRIEREDVWEDVVSSQFDSENLLEGWEEEPEEEITNFPLRPEQEEAVEKALSTNRGMIVAPTGTGKTVIFVEIIRRLGVPKTIIVVPTKALMDDLMRRLIDDHHVPRDKIGEFFSERKELKHITLTTYASASMYPEIFDDFEVVIFDEVHHLLGEVRSREIIGYLSKFPDKRVYGFTATPPDVERGALLYSFLPVIFNIGFKEMREIGRVAKSEMYIVPVKLEPWERDKLDMINTKLRKLYRTLGTSDIREISKMARSSNQSVRQTAHAILKLITDRKKLLSSAKSKFETLVRLMERIVSEYDGPIMFFTDLKDTLFEACRMLNSVGISCRSITGETKKKDRPYILNQWKRGNFRVIGSINVLTEGIDVPHTKVGVFMGGAGGKTKIVQKIGRLLRPHGDEVAQIYLIYIPNTTEDRYVDLFSDELDVEVNKLEV